jgi:hypothetical protein
MRIIGRADYRGSDFIINAEMRQFLKFIKSIHINLNHNSEWLCASPINLWSFLHDSCPNLMELAGEEDTYLWDRFPRASDGKFGRDTLESACSSRQTHWPAESALRGLQHTILDRGWGAKGALPSVKFCATVRFCDGRRFGGLDNALIVSRPPVSLAAVVAGCVLTQKQIAQTTQVDDGQIETTVWLNKPVVDIYTPVKNSKGSLDSPSPQQTGGGA